MATSCVYWKEYFPSKVSPCARMLLLSRKAYSEMIELLAMAMFSHFHPNSGELTVQSESSTPRHSRSALMPPSLLPEILTPLSYHIAARQCSVISQSVTRRSETCQKG